MDEGILNINSKLSSSRAFQEAKEQGKILSLNASTGVTK